MISRRPCPVCSGIEAEAIHEHTFILFDGHPLSGKCVTVICRKCGLGFNQQVPPVEAYAAHYTELSKYATSFSPMVGADKFAKLADILTRIFPNKEAAILDVGCGAGGFLAKLRECGYSNLSAMDPNPACVEAVRRALNIDARVGVLSEPPFPLASFDLVISTGVLEHLLNPAEDLTGLKNLLIPGGAAFVVEPDASRYVEFLDAPFQDFNIEHINHFSPETLRSLFCRQGWPEIALGREVMPHTPKWNEPIVYGLFKPGGNTMESPVPGFDTELSNNLKAYVQKSATLLAEIDHRLHRDLASTDEVIVWGAGQTVSLLLSSTCLSKMNIRAVVDSNPVYVGRRLAGAPVGGPDIRGDFTGPVVVGTIREGAAVEKIIRETLKWNNPIVTLR
jgi:SAM-dependent methyltransferase